MHLLALLGWLEPLLALPWQHAETQLAGHPRVVAHVGEQPSQTVQDLLQGLVQCLPSSCLHQNHTHRQTNTYTYSGHNVSTTSTISSTDVASMPPSPHLLERVHHQRLPGCQPMMRQGLMLLPRHRLSKHPLELQLSEHPWCSVSTNWVELLVCVYSRCKRVSQRQDLLRKVLVCTLCSCRDWYRSVRSSCQVYKQSSLRTAPTWPQQLPQLQHQHQQHLQHQHQHQPHH